MGHKINKTINIRGDLMDFHNPKIMGIINVTPDSFYDESRALSSIQIEKKILSLIDEGADIIDIGAMSTRPGSIPISEELEWERLSLGLSILKNINSEIPVSIDTYRSIISKKAVDEFDVDIINDISGGEGDPLMFETIAELKKAYVLTHSSVEKACHHKECSYNDVTADVITSLSKKLSQLSLLGVCDVIIDPGFGFSKSLNENFRLLEELDYFNIFECPLLVGLSRKSMIFKTLDTNAENSLNATLCAEAFALDRGADILRVHDVGPTLQLVKIFLEMKKARDL